MLLLGYCMLANQPSDRLHLAQHHKDVVHDPWACQRRKRSHKDLKQAKTSIGAKS
jgi:hypothetical protein